jgi:hypothetical protein
LTKFAEDERQDDRWRLREELILSEVERDILGEFHRALHLQEALSAQYAAGSEIHNYYYERATKQYHAYANLMLPYDKHEPTQSVQSLVNLWKQVYGDPDNPEVAAEIEKTKKYLQSLKE